MTVRADVAVALPDAIEDLQAAPLLCGGVMGYRSLGISEIRDGGQLGSSGSGRRPASRSRWPPIAAVACSCARAQQEERARSLALGAEWAGGYDDAPPEPLDAAITFAPAGEVAIAALRALDRGGTVAINAIHLDRVPEFSYDALWWERSLRSVANVTRQDARELVELAATIPIHPDIEVHPLPDGNLALQRIASGAVNGAAVLSAVSDTPDQWAA